jgi:outer membrane protein OmpA-like peptidoglycan-associated protein
MLAAVEATTLPVLQARALLPPPKAEPPVMQPQAAAPAKEKAQEQPLPEPVNAVQAVGKIISNSVMTVSFEPNKVELDSTALRSIAEIGATLASNKQKTLKLELLTRETENLPATQRRQLAQDRIKVITDVLIASGVPSIRIQVESLPDASSAMQRQGAGMQLVARLRVVKAKSGTE